MLRHAAIFRVFTIFGFVFIAAGGFNYLVGSIKTGIGSNFIKSVFGIYMLVLFAILAMCFAKNGFGITVPSLFNPIAVACFNETHNVYGHIIAQLTFQLSLLLVFIVVCFTQLFSENTRTIVLSCVVVTEIFISVQLNLPATVISDIKPSTLQAKLNKLSTGFPVPPLNAMGSFTHFSNGSTLPIWYNLSFFKKTPAKDGFNSFYLQSVDDLNSSSRRDSFLTRSVVFFGNPETKFEIKKFEPNNIVVQSQSALNDVIHLQQNFYPGWKVFIDNQEAVLDHQFCSMNAPVPTGNSTIHFEYDQKPVKYLFLLSVITALLVVTLLLGGKLKSSLS